MSEPFFDTLSNWIGGVMNSPAGDMLPENTSPRGRNTVLQSVGQGGALMGARMGPQTGNITPVTGSPVMLGQYQLTRVDGSKTHLLVSDGGRLDKYNADTTTSAVNASAFTAGTNIPSFATVNNLAVIANGVNLKKTDGITVWGVGITRPAAPTVNLVAAGAMSAAVWDVGLTYFNSSTGEESSLSDFTTVTTAGGNLSFTVSWSAPADSQVDYVRVYLRRQSVGANAYLLITGVTPAVNVTWNGYAVATTSTTVNVSDNQYSALKLLAPTTTSNNPPAVTLQYPVWHNSRLFLFDASNAYYSNISDLGSHPESFDPLNVQPIGPTDGDTIVGAFSMPSGSEAPNQLVVFKKNAVWVISGTDPTTWVVDRLSDRHGCCSHQTIKMAGGALYWWANSGQGLLTMASAGSQPLEVGKELLSASVSDTALNTNALNIAVAEVDTANDIVMFALPLTGSSARNNVIIPFNYRVKRFVADAWTPMDISCFAVINTATGKAVYAGGYAGQIFKWWQSTNDGVPSGTGSGQATSGSSNTLVDSTAAFSTTGGKLIERYVYHIPAAGDVQRRRITGNTATALTVTPAWDQAVLPQDYYVVGGIDWQLDTPWMTNQDAFRKKNFGFLYITAISAQAGAVIEADVFTKDHLATPVATMLFSTSAAGALYGTAVYGVDRYADSTQLTFRQKIGLTGRSIRIRLRQLQADRQVQLQKIGIEGRLLGTKT